MMINNEGVSPRFFAIEYSVKKNILYQFFPRSVFL